jgi:predicted transposase YdaD
VEFYEYLRENIKEIKDLNNEDRRILDMCVKIMDIAYGYNQSEKIKKIFETNRAEEADGMLVDIIENAKKEKESLLEKGKLEIAKNLLEMGLSVEQVSKGTKLPVEKLKKIKDILKN